MAQDSSFSPRSEDFHSAPDPLEEFDPNEWDEADAEFDAEARRERDQPAYLPTPEQIVAACAEIRAAWSMDERARRGIGPRRKF